MMRHSDPLLFPADRYTVETMRVMTSAGGKEVTYRSYMHLPYVAAPVDEEYQSLDVKVPVRVDGVAVDVTDVPILLANSIGATCRPVTYG